MPSGVVLESHAGLPYRRATRIQTVLRAWNYVLRCNNDKDNSKKFVEVRDRDRWPPTRHRHKCDSLCRSDGATMTASGNEHDDGDEDGDLDDDNDDDDLSGSVGWWCHYCY
jgi:hypothetical protein